MIRVAMRAFAALALLSGTVLMLAVGEELRADPNPGPVIDCDCTRPTDGTTPCESTFSKCETETQQQHCTKAYRVVDKPLDCRSTTNLTVCSKPLRDCLFQVDCIWDNTKTPKCKTGGDTVGGLVEQRLKPVLGNCPAGATKCAP